MRSNAYNGVIFSMRYDDITRRRMSRVVTLILGVTHITKLYSFRGFI